MPDIIRPEDLADLTSMAETGPALQGETQAPHDDPGFEAELERAERRLRYAHEHPMFGVHPEGLGPTLGQDLGRPNPGHDVDRPDSHWPDSHWNDDRYDPPT